MQPMKKKKTKHICDFKKGAIWWIRRINCAFWRNVCEEWWQIYGRLYCKADSLELCVEQLLITTTQIRACQPSLPPSLQFPHVLLQPHLSSPQPTWTWCCMVKDPNISDSSCILELLYKILKIPFFFFFPGTLELLKCPEINSSMNYADYIIRKTKTIEYLENILSPLFDLLNNEFVLKKKTEHPWVFFWQSANLRTEYLNCDSHMNMNTGALQRKNGSWTRSDFQNNYSCCAG